MTIASICQRNVVALDERASLQQAACLMRDRHVGALVLVAQRDGAARLSGVVTDRDLALQALAEGLDPQGPVSQLAKGTVVAVPLNASKADAAQAMRDAGVRRLLVTDRENQLAGIVTLDDLIAAYADELGDIADALQRGIELEEELDAATSAQVPGPVQVPDDLAATWQRTIQP